MSKKQLDASWQGWVKENLQRQCSPEELLGILLRNAFSVDSIRASMGEHFPIGSPLLTHAPVMPDYQALAKVRLTQRSARRQARVIKTKLLQIYELENFLSAQQCDDAVALIRQRLRPSTVSAQDADRYFRTSSTCDLSLIEDPLVSRLDEVISSTLGVRLPYSEGIQAQRYEVGQEFKAHTDFFEPATEEFARYCSERGNRTWTFVVYLNDVVAGGGTHFVSLNRTIAPKKGKAVAWNNLHPDGTVNRDSLHAGMPVENGEKIIITKWFREKGSGPMFFK